MILFENLDSSQLFFYMIQLKKKKKKLIYSPLDLYLIVVPPQFPTKDGEARRKRQKKKIMPIPLSVLDT